MTRGLIAMAVVALVAGNAEACTQFSGTAQLNCLAWNAIGDAFTRAKFTKCSGAHDIDPCGNCPNNNGFIACSGDAITRIRITAEKGMVWDPSYDIADLETALLNLPSLDDVLFEKQASLAFDQCMSTLCSSHTCSFAGSECTGDCTEDGICLATSTDAPTDAPTEMSTTAAPTVAPTDLATSAPTDGSSSTPAPTDGSSSTPAPTDGTVSTPAPTASTPAPTVDEDIRGEDDLDCGNSTFFNCTSAPSSEPTASPTESPSAAGTLEIGVLSAVVMLANALW